MAIEFNETNFKSEVLDSSSSSVVDFWAPWCGPCRIMGPIVDALSKKYEGKVKIGKVNVDENANLAGEYNVMSIPTILFFKNGKLVHQQTGSSSSDALENEIKTRLL
ncbi:MAG: thioredoxin [Candidatus Riflebacteria bacterium]|nr:thioredoxin [Candidatus Riflebacteria bacterium]